MIRLHELDYLTVVWWPAADRIVIGLDWKSTLANLPSGQWFIIQLCSLIQPNFFFILLSHLRQFITNATRIAFSERSELFFQPEIIWIALSLLYVILYCFEAYCRTLHNDESSLRKTISHDFFLILFNETSFQGIWLQIAQVCIKWTRFVENKNHSFSAEL